MTILALAVSCLFFSLEDFVLSKMFKNLPSLTRMNLQVIVCVRKRIE